MKRINELMNHHKVRRTVMVTRSDRLNVEAKRREQREWGKREMEYLNTYRIVHEATGMQ